VYLRFSVDPLVPQGGDERIDLGCFDLIATRRVALAEPS
jgi:hypothetical protein